MPITAIAVFGVGALIASAVGVAIWLGFQSARQTTETLLTERAQTLIGSMETTIDGNFRPVVEQSKWIRRQVESGALDIGDTGALDVFMRGVFAGTPDVAGIAIVYPDGISRRWGRADLAPVEEDWSGREAIRAWLSAGSQRDHGIWEQPFWTPTLDDTVLLHDEPMFREGQFLGMVGQVVPVSRLSRLLVRGHAETGLVPFVLYGKERVLAHSLIQELRGAPSEDSAALPSLEELGDAVLARIWTPDEEALEMLQGVADMQSAFVRYKDTDYVFLYRFLDRYGPQPWVLGAYLDTNQHGDAEIRRVILTVAGGIAVMVGAVAIAMLVGLRISRHLTALATAADEVQSGRLEAGVSLGRSGIREISDLMHAFGQMLAGLRERHLMRSTLGRFVPEPVARTLLDEGGQLEPRETVATILFCDLEGFTALTESCGAQGIVSLLNAFFSEMVHILERHGGVVTQFQGDAILATFNVPITDTDHAGNAVRAALEMQRRVTASEFAGERLRIRIGINTGTVVAGAVGADERLSYTVHGDAVNLAARLESLNKKFGTRILASEATISLVSGFDTHRIGETSVRGQTQPIAVYDIIAERSLQP